MSKKKTVFKDWIKKHFLTPSPFINNFSRIHQKRQEALNIFLNSDFPTQKEEEWKYTSLRDILHPNYCSTTPYTLTYKDVNQFRFGHIDCFLLVFLNGKFIRNLSSISPEFSILNTQKGVNIMSLTDACKEHFDAVDAHLIKHIDISDIFLALNTVSVNDGAFIRIQKNIKFGKPILILHFSVGITFSQPHHLIVTEENSEITVIEHFISLDDKSNFTNTVTEMILEKNSRLNHYKMQTDCGNDFHIGNTYAIQKEDSILNSKVLSTEGRMIRNNLNTSLKGENAQVYMDGFYMLSNKSHIDNHTHVDHIYPNTYSSELYKGILDENATGVFDGKILVRQQAQKTNAFQSNKNILLSKNASINAKPQLKIGADDVKCSHGCTVGNLDKELLFYLRSRGIPEKEAKTLLMQAFAKDFLDTIKIDFIKHYIKEKITQRLN